MLNDLSHLLNYILIFVFLIYADSRIFFVYPTIKVQLQQLFIYVCVHGTRSFVYNIELNYNLYYTIYTRMLVRCLC